MQSLYRMVILSDLRRTACNALQFLIQGKDKLRRREALARVSVNGHPGMIEVGA